MGVLLPTVGWVKRDKGSIFVGFAYFNYLQNFEIVTELANPTSLVADRRLNPTHHVSFRTAKWINLTKKSVNNQRPPLALGV